MAGTMHPTRIDIPEEQRTRLVALLNRQLADTLDLYSQTKFAHWNVKGSDFIQLHLLYDQLAEHLIGHVDLIAERATTLGGTALGTARMSAKASTLEEFPATSLNGMDSVKALADRFAAYAQSTRNSIEESEKLEDTDTSDLFTEVSRQIDTDLWFLEAHIQEA
jgi:starvation-inducible DNA-binding protein